MRALKLLAVFAGVALVHFFAARLWPELPAAVDLFLVVAILNALDGHLLAAMAGGLVAGLASDALTGGLFGLYGFADTLLAYATAFAARRLVIRRTAGVFLVCAAAAAAQQGVVAGLSTVLLVAPELPTPLWVGVRFMTSGVFGLVLYGLKQRLERRSQRRGSRRRALRS